MLTDGRPNARLPRGGYVWPDVHYPTVLFGFTDDVLFRLRGGVHLNDVARPLDPKLLLQQATGEEDYASPHPSPLIPAAMCPG